MNTELTHLSLSTLRGVGKQTLPRLHQAGLVSVLDVLLHCPIRYQDRTRLIPIADLIPHQFAVIEGHILSVRRVFGKKLTLHCEIEDVSGRLTAIFFHLHAGLSERLMPGAVIRAYGDVGQDKSKKRFILLHPACEIAAEELPPLDTCLTPVYPLSEGLTQSRLRGLIQQAIGILENHAAAMDLIPAALRGQYAWPDFMTAVKCVHQPSIEDDVNALLAFKHPAQERLIAEEMIAHQLRLRRARARIANFNSYRLSENTDKLNHFISTLPFPLTQAQKRVMQEILLDLQSDKPMQRLLQGDVGAGKTLVAACMLLQTVASGYQAAFMAPTELLAEQHYQQCERWFKPLSVRIVFLTGKLGFPERQEALSRIANGEADIIVGTHALFQQEVSFHQLALVCIDEQHRFGVKQRAALFDKGNLNARVAHQLVMTATPIPRTLALVQYADLDYSVLDELPPGRIPIQSAVLSNTRRGSVIKRVHELCQKGKQVYWVCPLIESSETLQAENVAAIAAELQTVLSDCCIGFIHGRLSSEEKNQTMRAFNKGAVDVLVATTVIEVGVDVPNAVLMVIENAERMGLAQLHQLRGRVGRGRDPSFCIFLYQTPLSIPAKERLAVLRESQDGFHIAERDLALRGSGDLLGTRQAGAGGWRIANPVRDSHWLIAATQIADNLLKEDSSLAERLEGRWYQKAAAGSKTG